MANGLFGGIPRLNPNQRFGGGYDPVSGTMSLSGMDASPLPQMQGSPMQATVPQIQQPPGMFGAGGVGRNIAGMIGDFLMQRAGMQPLYAPMMMKRQEMALEEAKQQREQQAELARQKELFKYEQDVKGPDYGQFGAYLEATGVMPGSDAWIKAMQDKVDNETNPAVLTPQGMMLRSDIRNGTGGTPAPSHVTFTPIGGQTPPASGGFSGY